MCIKKEKKIKVPTGLGNATPAVVPKGITFSSDTGINQEGEAEIGSAAPVLQEKTATKNGDVTADAGYDGLSKVKVNVPIPDGYIKPSGSKEITENGTHPVTEYEEVIVNVAGSGGGECSGEHVIPVAELPTSGINKNAIYDVTTREFVAICNVGSEGTVIEDYFAALAEMYEQYGLGTLIVTYHTVASRPTENIQASSETEAGMDYHMYYVLDEQAVLIYAVDPETGDGSWQDMGITGTVSSTSEATAEGLYAVLVGGGYFKHIDGKWVHLGDDSSEEVTVKAAKDAQVITPTNSKFFSKVIVEAAEPTAFYKVSTTSDLPTDASHGSLALVIRG